MEARKFAATERGSVPGLGNLTRETSIALEGLDDLFKWASETVAEGEDPRARRERDQRIRRRVMETVQHLREQQAMARSAEENAYLQRRLVAVLQKLQEYTEENSILRQIMVTQSYALAKIPALDAEIKRLGSLELHVDSARRECQDLLGALSKLKVDRDFLEELVRVNEEENSRLAEMLAQAREELFALKSKKWWQFWRR